MLSYIGRIFPVRQFARSNRAIQILTLSDTLFFSGMELSAIMFSVFVVQSIPGATVVELGIAHAVFFSAIILFEPLFAKFYDSALSIKTSYYGFILGNTVKSIARVLFIFLGSVSQLYILFFILGIVHAVEYPSFAKLFSLHIDKGHESFQWSYKDTLISLGKMLVSLSSGFIVAMAGFKTLFAIAAAIMFLFGVILPLLNKKVLIGE